MRKFSVDGQVLQIFRGITQKSAETVVYGKSPHQELSGKNLHSVIIFSYGVAVKSL